MKVLLVLFLMMPGAFAAAGDIPLLEAGQKIAANGEAIDIQIGHLVPCVTDWNGDGKKDLVVGQFSGGRIRLYVNEGTDAEPLFKTFVFLEAGGKEISLPAG